MNMLILYSTIIASFCWCLCNVTRSTQIGKVYYIVCIHVYIHIHSCTLCVVRFKYIM